MNKKSIIVPVLIAVVAAAWYMLSFRDSKQDIDEADDGKLRVAASFYPLYFLADKIGGERVEAVNMTPAGAEPHDYELSPKDVALVEKSSLLILCGGNLEAWGEDVAGGRSDGSIVYACEGLMAGTTEEGGVISADPHVWLSPALYSKMAEKIAISLESIDPDGTVYYRANLAALEAELSDLDSDFRDGTGNCARKEIVTSHEAFGYLAAAYGFEQVSIAGLSPDAEPSPRQLAEVAEFARANDVKYIFFESLISPELAETIAEEVGAATLVLNPLEGLSEEEAEAGRDYISEMESNLANLRLALECD